jgi:ABC-type multidrug transport system fused ATPase/permease subunit
MNSIERIKEYEKLPQEAPAIIKTNRPPPDWPQKGKIVFKNLSLKYRNVCSF